MPYAANETLPRAVRRHLPAAAQSLYRTAFNRAWQSYRHDAQREEIAHRVAWAAVKKGYRRQGGMWVRGGGSPGRR